MRALPLLFITFFITSVTHGMNPVLEGKTWFEQRCYKACHWVLFDKTLCSSLHDAIKNNCKSCSLAFIRKYPASIEVCDERGFKPIHYAIMHGNLADLEMLLTLNANVEGPVSEQDNHYAGFSPLQLAVVYGKLDYIWMLLLWGATKPTYRFLEVHGDRDIERVFQEFGRWQDAQRRSPTLTIEDSWRWFYSAQAYRDSQSR